MKMHLLPGTTCSTWRKRSDPSRTRVCKTTKNQCGQRRRAVNNLIHIDVLVQQHEAFKSKLTFVLQLCKKQITITLTNWQDGTLTLNPRLGEDLHCPIWSHKQSLYKKHAHTLFRVIKACLGETCVDRWGWGRGSTERVREGGWSGYPAGFCAFLFT